VARVSLGKVTGFSPMPERNHDATNQFAAEATKQWLWSHSIGLVNGKRLYGKHHDGRPADEEQPGSGFLISWGKHSCVLTAKHVVEGADKSDIRFFLRAPTPDYMSREERLKCDHIEVDAGKRAEIYKIDRCEWEDIAVLTIDPSAMANAEFFDFNSGWNDPTNGDPIYGLGFPTDNHVPVHIERTKEVEHHLLGLIPTIFSSMVIPKPNSLLESLTAELPYDPDRHFLISWDVDDEKLGMKGFSGAATWTDRPVKDKELWSPKLFLTGMVTHYYARIKVGRMIKASVLKKFLEEVFGPA
jgi:hypothetical protein